MLGRSRWKLAEARRKVLNIVVASRFGGSRRKVAEAGRKVVDIVVASRFGGSWRKEAEELHFFPESEAVY